MQEYLYVYASWFVPPNFTFCKQTLYILSLKYNIFSLLLLYLFLSQFLEQQLNLTEAEGTPCLPGHLVPMWLQRFTRREWWKGGNAGLFSLLSFFLNRPRNSHSVIFIKGFFIYENVQK